MFSPPPLLFPFSSVSLTSFSINIFFFHFQHFFFCHLAFILVILVFEFWLVWVNSKLKRSICRRILCPIFTPSFFKVNCCLQWGFSVCDERSGFSTDYLPTNMMKVTAHLCVCSLPQPSCLGSYLGSGFTGIPVNVCCNWNHSKPVCDFISASNIFFFFIYRETQKIFVRRVVGTLRDRPSPWRKTSRAKQLQKKCQYEKCGF